MSDLITISSSVVPESAKVVGFRGTETMSRPYEIEIFLALRQELGEEFDLADAIGAKARLVIDRVGSKLPPFVFAGIFANIEVLHTYEGHLLLRALLVPRLWQLGLSRHSRMFTKMKVPDIIRSVLEENGVTEFELRLGSYELEEHVCQYRESDLDFISRWMEREGIFYFFEHGDEGETLILSDQRVCDADPVGKPVRYSPQLGHDHSAGASFRSFKCRHSTLPANVRLKDYDYAKPGLNVSGSARVASNGTGEVSLYGERFFTPSAGDKLARTRSEEMLARQVVYRAEGTRLHLRPGYGFELEEHPFASFNTRYHTVEARHSGNQAVGLAHFHELTGIDHSEVYQVEVDAILEKTQFRPESLTAWPRIYGFENGVVDGPADSEYAQIDDQGRYNAKFKFDEGKLKGGKATTWVRMMQPHGGDIEGFHFPLRKGTEVVFSFLGGDCDRPVISGVVPNAVNPSPVTLANYTKNVIQTGARNRFELEDKGGSEWIRLSTPYASTFVNMGLAWPQHELNFGTTANAGLTAQGAFDIAVGNAEPGPSGAGNMTVHVLNNLTTTVDNVDMKTTVSTGNASLTVSTGTLTETIKGDTYRHVTTGNNTIDVDAGDMATDVKAGAMTTHVKSDATTTVNGATKHRADGTTEILSGGKITMETDAGSDIDITGDEVKITSRADLRRTVTGTEWIVKHEDTHEETFGDETKITHGDSDETTFGSKIEKTLGAYDISLAATGFKLDMAATGVDIGIAATGAKIELDLAALKLTVEAAIAIELTFGLTFSNAPVEVDDKLIKTHTALAKVHSAATHLHLGALKLEASGLHIKV